MFYDWLPTGTYEQSLRVDGVRQQELNIVNPSFPDPGQLSASCRRSTATCSAPATACRASRASARGVDQGFIKVTRVAATYSYQRGSRLARGLESQRRRSTASGPIPRSRNIVEVVSDAASRQHQLQVDAQRQSRRAAAGVQRTAHQLEAHDGVRQLHAGSAAEQHRRRRSAIPATGDLTPSGDRRRTTSGIALNITFNNQIVRNVLVGAERQRDIGATPTRC